MLVLFYKFFLQKFFRGYKYKLFSFKILNNALVCYEIYYNLIVNVIYAFLMFCHVLLVLLLLLLLAARWSCKCCSYYSASCMVESFIWLNFTDAWNYCLPFGIRQKILLCFPEKPWPWNWNLKSHSKSLSFSFGHSQRFIQQ